jgi:hypothetical protein
MVHSRSAYFRAFQKLFCRFYVDDIDVLRISLLPSVLGTVRNPTSNLGYSLLCSNVRHVCSPVRHIVEHSTLLY